MMMDCKKSSGHTPVVYISWHILVSSVMASSSKLLSFLLVYCLSLKLCCFSVLLLLLLPLPQVPLVQCLPHSLVSLPPLLGYHAFLCLRFCKVRPHIPSSGF